MAISTNGSRMTLVTGYSFYPYTGEDIVTFGYDPAGSPVWFAQYCSPGGPTFFVVDRPRALAVGQGELLSVAGYAEQRDTYPGYSVGVCDFLTVLYRPQLSVTEPTSPSSPASVLSMHVAPNPFDGLTRLNLDLPGYGYVSVRIYDPAGRLIRTLADHAEAAIREYPWDGHDETGSPVPSGVYLVSATWESATSSRPIRVMRISRKLVVQRSDERR